MSGLIGTTEPQHLMLDAAAAQRAGDMVRASDLLAEALRRDPGNPLAATQMAELDIARSNHASATPRLEAVLRQEPNFAPALAALAQACWLAGRPAEGLAHARRAVAIQPPNPHFRLVLAQLCAWLGHDDEARVQLAPVLENPILDAPMRARALSVLGEWHITRGEFAAANAPFQAALALAPDAAETHAVYGMNLLRLGQYDAAWREYEWHRQVPFFRGSHTKAASHQPGGRRWTGEDLHGRTILLSDDQGYGDAIQFFRYLRLIRQARPARIVLCTLAALASLFAASAPFVEVVTEPPDLAPDDYHCVTSNLPAVFQTRLDSIPGEVPYLSAPRVPRRLRLARGALPLVGLAWSGDPRHLRDHQRSIPAARFLTITEGSDLSFQSLQVAVRPRDHAALAARPGIGRIGETLRDFAETAAVLTRFDLVITVDTSLAHLAGALGRPVWLLLPEVPDWRWLMGRDDSPWYPTLRLFRSGRGGWPTVLRRVRKALRDLRG